MQMDFSPNPEGAVIVMGAAGVDIVGRLKGEVHMGASNPAHIRTSFGGVARNVAETLARLGQPVQLMAAVGQDEMGVRLVNQLVEAGVGVSAIQRLPERPTGAYLAMVNTRGELQFALDDMRATAALTPLYVEQHAGLFADASALFVDSNLPKETLRKAISLARKARLPIIADPTSIHLAHKLRPYLRHLSLTTPNAAEAGILCDLCVDVAQSDQALEAAKRLVSLGVKIAVITLAQFGLCYATSASSGYIPALRTEIVDPTGVGDALTAALIFALLNEIPLDDAMGLGVSAAALTLHHMGTVLPDLTLEKLYDRLVI
jgi:pseudouridine kinase